MQLNRTKISSSMRLKKQKQHRLMNRHIRLYLLICLLTIASICNSIMAAVVKGHISDKRGEDLEFVTVSLTQKDNKSTMIEISQ